ncbi:MAG: PEGA domain-containing protein, partial [bacterium]|nr:PEGA domain-containing protein [bacterium]
ENELLLQNLSAGEHVLSVKARYGTAPAPFTYTPGAAPRLTGEMEAREVIAVAVAQLGETATVYCNCAPTSLMVDDRLVGDIESEGLHFDNLPQGFHVLTLGDKKDSRQVALDTSAAPALHLFLHSDRNVGAIAVAAGDEDGATVTLNGKPYRRTTKRGRVRIYALPVATYRIGVSKDGFEPVEEKTVRVRKGRVATVGFPMQPIRRS